MQSNYRQIMDVTKLRFSGHESFHCRTFWLKKGFDFVSNGNVFSDESGIELGVGKNMVDAIRHWLKSFGIVNEDGNITQFANRLFQEDGWDPFLEDEASLWLLHFQLVNRNYASIYPIIFTNLRKVKPDFSKNHLVNLVLEIDNKQNENTLDKDFTVFVRTYFAQNSNDKEESFSGILHELGLLKESDSTGSGKAYHVINTKQASIPAAIVLYAILENEDFESSISMNSLLGPGISVGNIFAFTPEGLENKLIEIAEQFPDIVYRNNAGIKELQFKGEKPESLDILNQYYGN
jgi:hypothetical protein